MSSYVEKSVISCFDLIFGPFLAFLDLCCPQEAPISEQVLMVYIAWCISQGYKPFKWDSRASIAPYLKKNIFFCIFMIFHQNLGFLALRGLIYRNTSVILVTKVALH